MNTIKIYTDGSAPSNGKLPGGWAAVIIYKDKEYAIKGHTTASTTNNIMELTAIIEALKRLQLLPSTNIEIYTDSQYVKNGITTWIHSWKKNNWRRSDGKPVLNVELWKDLQKYSAKHRISWHWVKGHAGHPENERANELAQQQAQIANRK